MSPPLSAKAAVLAFTVATGSLPGVHLKAQEAPDRRRDLAAFLAYFEPERAATLGVTDFRGRVTDLSEEGLAARARGYTDLRARLADAPGIRDDGFVGDPLPFLDRRLLGFSRVRPWFRSPLYYVETVSRALASIELDPGLAADERRGILTERARQLPTAFAAARANLVNPPRFLTLEAVRQARELEDWIEDLLRVYRGLPETGEKWAFETSVRGLQESLVGYVDHLEGDLLPRSNGAVALGEELLSELARTWMFGGVYHAAELLDDAAAELGGRLASALAGRGMELEELYAPVDLLSAAAAHTLAEALQNPGQRRVRVDFGGALPGFPPAAVVVHSMDADAGEAVQVYAVRDGPVLHDEVLGVARAELAWHRGAVAAFLPGAGDDPSAGLRLLVGWEHVAGGGRWLALASGSSSSGALDRAGVFALAAALEEVAVARDALSVHLGRTTVDEAVERIVVTSGVSQDRARRALASLISDPTSLFVPAVGFTLYRWWVEGGRPDVAAFVEDSVVGTQWPAGASQ